MTYKLYNYTTIQLLFSFLLVVIISNFL